MYTFIIRNNPTFVHYVRYAWGYFLRRNVEGVKITIRKNSTFIHIDKYYCVILNDLRVLRMRGTLEAKPKAMAWLKKYGEW